MDFNSGKENKYRRRNLGIIIGIYPAGFLPFNDFLSWMTIPYLNLFNILKAYNKSNVSMYKACENCRCAGFLT